MVRRVTISSGAVREFAYDHRNRLVQVSDRPSASGAVTQIVKYTYDLLNRRIAMNVDKTPADAIDGVITYFVNDGQDVIADLIDSDGSGPASPVKSMRYLHGPAVDQILAQEDAVGTVLWDLTDHLGSVRDLVNSQGQIVNHLKYDSYGNVVSQSNPAASTRYRYTGREFDAETGLQYNRARYYDAAIGRFVSEDPIGFGGSDVNLYRYVSNRPLSATDPSGLSAKSTDSTGSGTPLPRPIFGGDLGADKAAEKLENNGYEITPTPRPPDPDFLFDFLFDRQRNRDELRGKIALELAIFYRRMRDIEWQIAQLRCEIEEMRKEVLILQRRIAEMEARGQHF
jgi:RHS repeat-associated protein